MCSSLAPVAKALAGPRRDPRSLVKLTSSPTRMRRCHPVPSAKVWAEAVRPAFTYAFEHEVGQQRWRHELRSHRTAQT